MARLPLALALLLLGPLGFEALALLVKSASARSHVDDAIGERVGCGLALLPRIGGLGHLSSPSVSQASRRCPKPRGHALPQKHGKAHAPIEPKPDRQFSPDALKPTSV